MLERSAGLVAEAPLRADELDELLGRARHRHDIAQGAVYDVLFAEVSLTIETLPSRAPPR